MWTWRRVTITRRRAWSRCTIRAAMLPCWWGLTRRMESVSQMCSSAITVRIRCPWAPMDARRFPLLERSAFVSSPVRANCASLSMAAMDGKTSVAHLPRKTWAMNTFWGHILLAACWGSARSISHTANSRQPLAIFRIERSNRSMRQSRQVARAIDGRCGGDSRAVCQRLYGAYRDLLRGRARLYEVLGLSLCPGGHHLGMTHLAEDIEWLDCHAAAGARA